MRPLHRKLSHEGAGTELIGFLVALSMVSVGIGTVILVSYGNDSPLQRSQESEVSATASRLADLILNEAGNGWYAGSACNGELPNKASFSPDGVTRFGLASDACRGGRTTLGNVSYDKLLDLTRGQESADGSNGHVDYEEARQTLGLADKGLDFHLRSQPIMQNVVTMVNLGAKDMNLRVGYIGDYEPSGGSVSVQHTTGIVDSGTQADAWVHITNDGLTTTIFEVTFTLELEEGTAVITQHTPVVAPGTDVNISIALPKSNDWAFEDTLIDYVIQDPLQVLGTGSIDTAAVDLTGATSATVYAVNPDRLSYLTTGGADPKIYYQALDGAGEDVAQAGWVLEIYNALGLLVASDVALHDRGWESFSLPLAGTYDVYLKDALGGILAQDTLVNLDLAPDSYSQTGGSSSLVPQEPVATEADMVALLVDSFTDGAYSAEYSHVSLPFVAGGDVYPDAKAALDSDFVSQLIDDAGTPLPLDDAATLANYNIVVVGSNVDHNAMTSNAVKDAVRDWVELGGVLIVLGGIDSNLQWLQPLFDAGSSSSSGAVTVPDPSSPLLNSPNNLDWESWTTGNRSWSYSGSNGDQFMHILQQDGDDVLALSKSGAFGDGRVVLSSYQPYDLFEGAEPASCGTGTLAPTCPALKILHNFLTRGYGAIDLDFGPPIPGDRMIGTTTRVASVYHPDLEREIAIQLTVYVF